ncbi:hypothetical protein SAMIE_1032860 [Sphingobium amiense]|uniref:Uncharacterized protein n=1 Tax=Sphingobium amiense TaxID=135719 RepID=A0A494WFW4_9SPHN|nr:hypothetical protein [Sphingobium amiense]BBD99785.1 hypothetical protein SAMIE_1032860 [Sphingobium amiense]
MRYDARHAQLAALAHRIDALAGQGHHMTAARMRDELDDIRRSARVVRLDDVEELADSLETMLSLHGLGCVILSYLDRMRDAVSDRLGPPVAPLAAPAAVLRLRA